MLPGAKMNTSKTPVKSALDTGNPLDTGELPTIKQNKAVIAKAARIRRLQNVRQNASPTG